jgi:E3 ubiquitin-protein ligase ZNF598
LVKGGLEDVSLWDSKQNLSLLLLFSKGDLDKHIESGDQSQGFAGHPKCKFCKSRFYDTMALYEHLVKNHFSCDICEKNGIKHKYYRDYRDLEKHFRHEHYLCEDPRCLEQKFVVFESQLQYQGHLIQVHPEAGASRKVPVAFRVRGTRRGGADEEVRP